MSLFSLSSLSFLWHGMSPLRKTDFDFPLNKHTMPIGPAETSCKLLHHSTICRNVSYSRWLLLSSLFNDAPLSLFAMSAKSSPRGGWTGKLRKQSQSKDVSVLLKCFRLRYTATVKYCFGLYGLTFTQLFSTQGFRREIVVLAVVIIMSGFVPLLSIQVSSAQVTNVAELGMSKKSLTYTINKRCPRRLPWRTLFLIDAVFDIHVVWGVQEIIF